MSEKEIGKIRNAPYEFKQIEWEIPDYFSVIKYLSCELYVSPIFSFADTTWQLQLWPYEWYISPDCIVLFLKSYLELEQSIEYEFRIKKSDGSFEHLVGGALNRDEYKRNYIPFITQTELLRRKSELVPCDILTIVCTLKMMTETSTLTQHIVSDETTALKLIRLDELSENFRNLFDDKESCDVTLKVKDKEYKAHKLVLKMRSKVFAATFKHDTLEKQTGIITISDCDPDSFEEFLKYLYCGKLKELSFPSALNLYYTSDKYDVQELKEFCIDYLKKCLSVENFCEIVNFADIYDETALFSIAQDFFNKNVNDVLDTSEWEYFMKMNSHLANKVFKAYAQNKI